MIRQAISTICAISFFFSMSLAKTNQERKPRSSIATFSSRIADGDAANIDIVNLRQLDDLGANPEFSPDGSKILFEKFDIAKPRSTPRRQPRPWEWEAGMVPDKSIWVMNRDGRNKIKLIDKATNGTWSPDGTKIAYNSINARTSGLSIYDIASKKESHLLKGARYSKIIWSRDATKLFTWNGYGSDYALQYTEGSWSVSITDLDNLQEKVLSKFPNMGRWIEQNGAMVVHPKVFFYGQWMINKDLSFRRIMIPGDWNCVNLSPDLSELVLGKFQGIWIADLRIIENPPNRTFTVDMGRNQLARLLNHCRNENILAQVNDAQINPLNQKPVGPGNKIKGKVIFAGIYDNYSEVRVVEEILPIGAGDILNNFFGGNAYSSLQCSIGDTSQPWGILRKQGQPPKKDISSQPSPIAPSITKSDEVKKNDSDEPNIEPIETGKSKKGAIAEGQLKEYKFAGVANIALRLTFKKEIILEHRENLTRYVAEIYNSRGQQLKRTIVWRNKGDVMVFTPQTDGWYILRLTGYYGYGNYTIYLDQI